MTARQAKDEWRGPTLREWVAAVLLCVTILGVGAFIQATRTHVHQDESMTAVLSNCNNYGWTRTFEEGRVWTAEECAKALYGFDGSVPDTLRDIAQLHRDTRDTPHSNLYYSLARLSLLGQDYQGLWSLFHSHGVLQLALAFCGFWLLFSLASRLLVHPLSRFACLALGFCTIGTFSLLNFDRPYMLQTVLFLVCVRLELGLLDNARRYADLSTFRKVAITGGYGLGVALTLLCSYFSLIFVGLMALALLIRSFHENDRGLFRLTLGTGVFALLFILLIYPKYVSGLFLAHASQARNLDAPLPFWESVLVYVNTLPYMVSTYFLDYVGLVFVLWVCHRYRRDANNVRRPTPDEATEQGADNTAFFFSSLTWISLLFLAVAMYLDPFKTWRFLTPVYPVLALVIARRFDVLAVDRVVLTRVLLGTLAFSLLIHPVYNYRQSNGEMPRSALVFTPGDDPEKLNYVVPFMKPGGTYRFRHGCPDRNWLETQTEERDLVVYSACFREDTTGPVPARYDEVSRMHTRFHVLRLADDAATRP